MTDKTNDPKTAAFHDALKLAYKMRHEDAFVIGVTHTTDDIYRAVFNAGHDHAAAELREKPFEGLLRRIDQILLEAGDEDPFAQHYGDGASLIGLGARDIYVLGRSTLLLNLMGKITAEWDVYHKAKAEPADNLAEVGEREGV